MMKSLPLLLAICFFTFTGYAQEGERITTESGLVYIKLLEGKGVKPKDGDKVKVFYTARLSSGKVFDSTLKSIKVTVGDKGFIPGFNEALKLMQEEERAKFIMPPHLGYGEKGTKDLISGQHSVPPNETISFEILLQKIY